MNPSDPFVFGDGRTELRRWPCTRNGVANEDARMHRNGGAIAFDHPLGVLEARLATLRRYGLTTLPTPVGQGIGLLLQRV